MNSEEQTKTTSFFTAKKIMRLLSLFCIIFVFCPSFMVSCSGKKVNVNVMTAVGGMSMYGEKVVDPHPIMLICLIIPIAMLVLLFIKKFTDKKTGIIIAACAAIDTIVWIIFRSTVKKIAEENYCTFKTTSWYVLNIISLVLIIVISVLIILKKIEMDMDLIAKLSGGDMQGKLDQVTKAVNNMSSQVSEMASSVAANISTKKTKANYIGYCAKCGSGIEYGIKFCTSCGTPVPQSMIEEAEEKRRLAEEQAAKEAEEKRLAEEQAAKEAEEKRLAEEKAAKEAEEKKLAEEKAAKEAEEKRLAEEQAAKEAEEKRLAEMQVTKEPEVEKKEEPIDNTVNAKTTSNYCQECGAKLEPDSVFCENCGTKVE